MSESPGEPDEVGRPARVVLALVARNGQVVWVHDSAGSSDPTRGLPYVTLLQNSFSLAEHDAIFLEGAVSETLHHAISDFDHNIPVPTGFLRVSARSVPEDSPTHVFVSHVALERDDIRDNTNVFARYRHVVEQLPAITYLQRPNPVEGMLFISPQIERLLGVSVEGFIEDPTTWLRIISSEDAERALGDRMRANSSLQSLIAEYRVSDSRGNEAWIHDQSVPVLADDGTLAYRCGIMLDITAQKEREAHLAHQAFHDQLTGLPSRALFLNRLETALARSDRRSEVTAVLFLDLDRFKVINDRLGHAAGDELLIQVGERLRTIVRPGDTVARLGGDEFVVLAEDITHPEIATRIASRIITGIRQPFNLHGQEVFVTTSVGVAFSGPSGMLASDLVRDADSALYRAKAEGRGRYEVFDTSIDRRARERLELETSLRQAVDSNQFVLHYQPIISLESGAMTGTEALLRWDHPTRGLLLPSEFLDVAEETGLMTPIGQSLLEEVCRQGQVWRREFPERSTLTVVVNISGNQFRQATLVDHVRRALRVSQLDPANLRLEITEDTIAYDREAAVQRITELKELGVQLAIDGFGLGSTSLAHLARLPVDTLEIDRRFISGRGNASRATALIHAIASLAEAFGAEVGAEGIETQEQLARVISAGVHRGQGNLFSQPVPADTITELLRADDMSWVEPASDTEDAELARCPGG
jgi:diguanylate cyclase (GGDEF)-like protein/PAS domain S-box-containing protein